MKNTSQIVRGDQLEDDFAEWMVRKLGYSRTQVRKHIPSSGGRPYEVDVYATRYDSRSARTARVGAAASLFVLAALVLGLRGVEDTLAQTVALVAPDLAGYAGLLALGAGALTYLYGAKRMKNRAFVECKEHKRRVGRPIISQIAGRMQKLGDAERRASGREEWMAVSASGFTKDALEAAREHEIKCYTRDGDRFVLEATST